MDAFSKSKSKGHPSRPSEEEEETPPNLFFQIYEIVLGNPENQVFVDFCPSYAKSPSSSDSHGAKGSKGPKRHQTFWQHFQKLLEAARLYARNTVLIEALAELMLIQGGEEPKIREARILDVATKPDELRRRFERHYDDSDRNIIVNEKWERFQEQLAQELDDKEDETYSYEDGETGDYGHEGDQEEDDNPFYDQEEALVGTTAGVPSISSSPSDYYHHHHHHRTNDEIPWEKQANAGAGVPPPHILARWEMAQRRKDMEKERENQEVKSNDFQCRPLEAYGSPGSSGTHVITHPTNHPSAYGPPWERAFRPQAMKMSGLEESLCMEVKAMGAKAEGLEDSISDKVPDQVTGQEDKSEEVTGESHDQPTHKPKDEETPGQVDQVDQHEEVTNENTSDQPSDQPREEETNE